MHYETFELRIQPGQDDTYEALVTRSLAGDARALFTLPWADGVQAATLWQAVGDSRTAAVSRHLGAASQEGEPAANLQALGTQLYEALFGGDVGACLRRSLDEAKRRAVGLRIRLRIDDRLPDLANLPWEYLYAPPLGRFLALSDDTPLLRYLEVAHAAAVQPTPPPLTVLAVLSNPVGVTPLAVEQEWDHLQEAVTRLGEQDVRLERIRATWPALQARLRQGAAHVIHFIGHGYFDERAQGGQGEGGLLFEDEAGQPVRVPAQRVKVLLHDQKSLRLVFLNACEGARGGRSDSFAGVAQQLVQQAVPAVLAMQFPVTDGAAILLSQEFYRTLAGGHPLEAATSAARKAIFGQSDGLEWGTPVLFSRADDNRLIELPQGDRRAVIQRKPFEPETVLIPGGPFPMGDDPGYEITLPAYRLGKYPVTHGEYAAFLARTPSQEVPLKQDYFNREPPPDRQDHPVAGIGWEDALAYCAWLSKETGRTYRLPTEAEWEKAARGVDGRPYPWGHEWRDGCAHVEGDDTAPVTAHEDGAGPYGVVDLLGNVQEWTLTRWGPNRAEAAFDLPYQLDDDRDDIGSHTRRDLRVLRGGSFRSRRDQISVLERGSALPDSRVRWRGFRVVMEI
jgi:formylglycine-generating enzyme required for sulfatase activity